MLWQQLIVEVHVNHSPKKYYIIMEFFIFDTSKILDPMFLVFFKKLALNLYHRCQTVYSPVNTYSNVLFVNTNIFATMSRKNNKTNGAITNVPGLSLTESIHDDLSSSGCINGLPLLLLLFSFLYKSTGFPLLEFVLVTTLPWPL